MFEWRACVCVCEESFDSCVSRSLHFNVPILAGGKRRRRAGHFKFFASDKSAAKAN